MKLQALAVFLLGVGARATDVAADFEKACQAGQQDCIESTEDMYLIQKKLEVGSSANEDPEGGAEKKEGGAGDGEGDAEKPDGIEQQKKLLEKEAKELEDLPESVSEAASDADDLIGAEEDLDEAVHSAQDAATKAAKDAAETKKAAALASKIQTQSADIAARLASATSAAKLAAETPSVPVAPTCPCGYTAKVGQIPMKDSFGQLPEAKTLFACSKACSIQDACQSFEFGEEGEPSCVLNTAREPTDALENPEYMFCAKGADCEIVPPWKDWDMDLTLDHNIRNVWTVAHTCKLQTLVCWLVTWGIWMTLSLLVLKTMLSGEALGGGPSEDPVETFQYGQFDCMKKFQICVYSFACPGARWAATMNLAGFLPATGALMAYGALGFLNGLICVWQTKMGGEALLCADRVLTGPLLGEASGVGADEDAVVTPTAMPPVHDWTVWQFAIVFAEGLTYLTMVGFCTAVLIVFYRQKLRAKLHLPAGNLSSWFFDFTYVFFCPWCAIAQEARVVQDAYNTHGRSKGAPLASPRSRVIR